MPLGFLFVRLSHWINCCVCEDSHLPVSKGDEEDHVATPEKIEALIKKCQYRATKFKFINILFLFLQASMAIVCAIINDLQYRFITSGIAIGLIFISNFLAWPEYAEKMHTLVDRLQDIKDIIDAKESLSGHDQIRLKRLTAMAGSPLLYSDKQFQIERVKCGCTSVTV